MMELFKFKKSKKSEDEINEMKKNLLKNMLLYVKNVIETFY